MNKGNTIPVNIDFKISTCIFNYIKDENNNKIGLMIAVNFGDDPDVYIGWSLCHSDDKYDQQVAFDIATFRAYSNKMAGDNYEGKNFMKPLYIPEWLECPNSIESEMIMFLNRTNRYFKLKKYDISFAKLGKELEDALRDGDDGFIKDLGKSFSPTIYGEIASMFGLLDKGFEGHSFKLNF